jgi:pimeloyl-ACP methyl ester carboxylesterase/DNA-binding CsgD family transcriptional regulator
MAGALVRRSEVWPRISCRAAFDRGLTGSLEVPCTRYGQPVKQEVRFCTSADGTRLAYAVHGKGPPLVRVATWLTHLDFDWESPVWRHWLQALGECHTVVRYDERGCGLSDADPGEPSLETWVADLEAVVEAVGLDRFALLGVSQGAGIAVSYAVRYPERVSDLVLYGGLLFLPDGTPEQKAWYEDLLRASTSADTAAELFEARGWLDVSELAPDVRTRTLVVHARDDRVVPVEEGRLLAALIPGARLILLDSANHILLADEPAWDYLISELHAFLGVQPVPPPLVASEFSAREREVLELVAAGLANEEIAERLTISIRTVERHLSNVYAKLGVSGKAARTAAAVRFSRLPEAAPPRP